MQTVKDFKHLAKIHKHRLNKILFNRFINIPIILDGYQLHELNAMLLFSIEKPVDLSRFLRIYFYELTEIINNPKYKFYKIPKKKRGFREIYEPKSELKKIQKYLNYYLQAYYLLIKPEEVNGFVINPDYLGKKCNIAANAQPHINKKYVLNIDLLIFFPSISAKRVKNTFKSDLFEYDDQISTALCLLTTYKGSLPIGAPTSPVISNFVCMELDKSLIEFCNSNSIAYTRYADDLSFSTNNEMTKSIINKIITIIENNRFRINRKKFRLQSKSSKQTVTGLVVNEKVNIDRKLLKRIRAMLYDLEKNGELIATAKHFNLKTFPDNNMVMCFRNSLKGYIDFVGQIRGRQDSLFLQYLTSYENYYKYSLHSGKVDKSILN